MSSPEVERFEVTEDDVANEFNMDRRRHKMSKSRQMLGIWGDDSDEDDRPGFGRGKVKKDFTAPIGFVSGGIKVGDKVTKAGDGGEEEKSGGDSDDDYDREALIEAMSRKKKYGKKGTFALGDAHKEHGMGSWEKHTKGIGQKLLQSMGYKPGQGLGKNQQGITTPVEAFKRKGKAAIGAYGSERTERSLKDYPVKPDSDEEEQKQFEEQLHQWKKGETKKKKVKYVYKTADQLLTEGPTKKKNRGEQSQLSKVKVIDMTGREQRVLSGYHAIAHKHEKPDEELPSAKPTSTKAFDMPELLHNLDLLVDMAEDEIIQNDRKLKHEQDLIVNLEHEKKKADEICEKEQEQMERLKEILSVVEECQERTKVGAKDPMTLEDCANKLKQLQEDYPNEYRLFDLWALSIALVFPLMKKEFEGWNPLSRPRHGIVVIKTWKTILEDPLNRPYQGGEPHMEPYERLIWEVWMPHIRSSLQDWSVRSPETVIEVIEAWLSLLPQWIIDNILEQIILPKLQDEVDTWNPLTDTMPIHAWLHPWLPVMKDRLTMLHAPIRQKLSNALTNWHPSDPSAKMILQPWKGVFADPQMNAFVVKNILPKLSLCMQEFVINPHQQHLDAWGWVMAWIDLVPLKNIVSILLKHFFPKWLQVLCTWLGNNPNFDEITKWYKGWKSMFGNALLEDGQIKEEFNKALELMNRAASGHWQGGPSANMAYLSRNNPYPPQPPPDKRDFPGVRASMSVPTSFKDLIEKKAEENNLVFMPLPNKTWEAKQLYGFGKVQIYIDKGVIFVSQNSQWLPISLNNLVDIAR